MKKEIINAATMLQNIKFADGERITLAEMWMLSTFEAAVQFV